MSTNLVSFLELSKHFVSLTKVKSMEYYLDVGEGEQRISPKEMKNNIGRRVRYLRSRDIDKSGRGYYFPREGTITGKYRSYVLINDTDESVSSFVEVILLPSTPTQ